MRPYNTVNQPKLDKVRRVKSALVLCKKVVFWTARAGRIPSIVIIFTFVILIQVLRLIFVSSLF